MVRVVYPGTFDPPHLGHLDIVKRSLRLFDEVLVAVAKNPQKKTLFTLEERVDMFQKMVEGMERVSVEGFECLLVDFMKQKNIWVIVRGVRLFTDFEYELLIAMNNHRLMGVETVFMMPSQEYIHISSSIVKDIASYCGNLENLVHPYVGKKLREKFGCY
ncbi:pantetheine-phosphate adenylyltransferase [Thermocrinis minervae]|uniref:Phosphopantetheine adenylyltransferase n=1 Tax=Thermocrinis minervae TaxID=381751 RepID=A0A1M6R7H5_9AQUI|nr:pantetheine-phosphate adenylyltransferase [Thermocrinis minervae]SHK28431.1 Phosphopantetheine adenylyltransferase [Thermocrinis minervae]